MKRLLMVGATITFMLTMGTAAFAANAGKTDVQLESRAAGCVFVDANNDGYSGCLGKAFVFDNRDK